MRKEKSNFPQTPWSLVQRVGSEDAQIRDRAVAEFLEAYFHALRRFLIAYQGMSTHDADELLQEFIATKILSEGIVRLADPSRGKLRNLLCRALSNFAISRWRRERKHHEGRAEMDISPAVASNQPDMEDILQCLWANQVFQSALAGFVAECHEGGRDVLRQVFELRLATPALFGDPPVPYDELGAQLGLNSPRQAINLLTTGKRMFRKHLESAIRTATGSNSDTAAEMRELRRAISVEGMEGIWPLFTEEVSGQ